MPRLHVAIRSTFRFVKRLRCHFFLVLVLACLVVRDQFPFSNFPMYSGFSKWTYYVHLANGADQPVATFTSAGMHTSKLKKVYDSELRKETRRLGIGQKKLTAVQKRPAGERVLAMLRESAKARGNAELLPAVLRLYEVNISLVEGGFQKQSLLIAEGQ